MPIRRKLRQLPVIALAAALGLGAAGQVIAQSAPFDGMAGSWSGSGSITLGSGERERIRCRVTYEVGKGGLDVEQDLRCASDSYKFEMLNRLTYNNGNVVGRWDEKTRRTGGTISGRAEPGRIQALAETGGFAAMFTLTTRGDQQTVKIESKSPEISDVSITLRRASR